MVETSAQLHQAAMVTKADGDIVQQHQESDFTENRKEVNMPQTIENADDKEELEMTKEKEDKEEEEKKKDSSSSSDEEEEKKSIAEVEDQLPPPPQDDFPPPTDELPSPSDELLPPPIIPCSEEDTNKDNNDVVDNGESPKDENNTEDTSKDGKSSYVALVSPTGFVPASFGDSTNDDDKNIAPTNSNKEVTESSEDK